MKKLTDSQLLEQNFDLRNFASEYPGEPNEVFYDHELSSAEDNVVPDDNGMPHYQCAVLPEEAKFVASSPYFSEKTVPKPIQARHMAPKGKCGVLVVQKGSLQFIWEDSGEVFDADAEHPIIIEPERYHHVKITEPVEFKIDFYAIPQAVTVHEEAIRPGEKFLPQK